MRPLLLFTFFALLGVVDHYRGKPITYREQCLAVGFLMLLSCLYLAIALPPSPQRLSALWAAGQACISLVLIAGQLVFPVAVH